MKVEMKSKPIKLVQDMVSEVSALEKQGQLIYFRGQEYPDEGNECKKERHLYPSVGKLYEYTGEKEEFGLESERDFLNRFCRYAYIESKRALGDWEALFLARHCGLPVRLLDWTANPLVALFFAAHCKETKGDAAVWAIVKKKGVEDINVLSEERKENTTKDPLYYQDLKELPIEDEKKKGLEGKEIQEIQKPLRLKGIRILYPLYVSPRMVVQHSFFTIQDNPWCAIDEYNTKETEDSIDIEKVMMWKVLKDDRFNIICQLERLGIDNRTIFPDLDGLAKGIWQLEIVRIHNRKLAD